MAATIAKRGSGAGSFHSEKIPGTFYDDLIEITGDASYPANGHPFGIAQLNTLYGGAYSVIESIEVVNMWKDATTHTFLAFYDKANGTVRAFGMAAAAGANTPLLEVATGNAALNGFTCTLRVRFS